MKSLTTDYKPQNNTSSGASTTVSPDGFPLENVVHRIGVRPYSMHYTEVTYGEKSALYLHCHPEAELFYLLEGHVCFHIENQNIFLQEGEAIFLPPDFIHSAECITESTPEHPCRFHALVFQVEALEQNLPPYCQEYFTPLLTHRMECIYPITNVPANKTLLALLSKLFSYYSKDLSTCELTITGLLLSIWQELYNLHFSALAKGMEPSSIQTLLQQSMEFMQANFTQSISLADIAGSVNLSAGHYCRSFKAYTGVAPFTYLNKIRIIRSCEFLTNSDKKITDIALLCGFNNISYFNRSFIKIMGVTPSEYRKANG